jgi:hypothetical protein
MAQNVLPSSSESDQARLKRPSSFAMLDVTKPRLTLDNMKHCSGSCDAYLLGVHLMGMHLMGMHLMGVHLMGVYLVGVHLTGCVPRWRAPHWTCTSRGMHLGGFWEKSLHPTVTQDNFPTLDGLVWKGATHCSPEL